MITESIFDIKTKGPETKTHCQSLLLLFVWPIDDHPRSHVFQPFKPHFPTNPPSSSSSPLVLHHNQLVILQQSKTTLTVYHSSFCFFVELSLKTTENQDSVGMSPRKIHFCTFLIVLFSFKDPPFVLASSRNVSLEFPSFNLRNLTLLGDSYLRNGVIGLTRDVTVPSSSSGTVIYNNPISFFDQESNTTASFSTRFSFSIRSANENSFGDGLSFFLSQDNQTLGSPGGYLGLVNSSQLTKNKFVAVEFDTRLDARFNDPNDHHIGLDIDSLNSVKTADPILQDIDLKSGDLITAWIDYKNDLRVLKVYMSYSSLKPINSLLTVQIDLSEYLKGDMYVGFSGSTEGSTELHLVTNWSLRISGFLPLNPNSDPYNVSDSSVTVTTPVIPISNAANKRHKSLGFGLGITGPAIFCTFLVAFGYISFRKWQKIERVKSLKAELMTGPKEFSYKELKLATRGFHSSRIIGRGAFGNVYKAFFKSSGTFAAVKRSKHSHEGKTEFLAELSIIACLRHKNLIPLQGWCVEKGEVLLVYEFMPHGSLDRMLYEEGSERGIFLNWAHRQKTAVGLASSLTYLHHECEQKVIHRDIKTSNIMLDGNFNARLGDFGLARIMEHDKSPVSTLTAGTMGYLAPEYLHCGIATEKTDVFSYGVVILELACGKRPIEKEPVSQKMVNLVDWVWGLYGEGKIIEAADSRLNGEFEEEEMRKLLLVGLSCANPDDTGRPAIRRVLQILNGEAEPIAVPRKKPSLTFSCDLAFTLENIVSDCD
ncbi:L-type lectin-domain containing receptor kinase S.7 [Populus alba x Populus x berolinensis]|uniref:non-specific serine/threonine protein kinase n=4 Tax=Populus TaxID=3689 RepID=A0AAD6RUS6_9ROSI|nr:L-type lectin-domain containing receptor kinase S.7 [Populus alba x Populus x berolinensis]